MDGTKFHREAHIINTNIQRNRERSQYRNTAEKIEERGVFMKLVYPAVFTPYEDGSGGYAVEFPDLPGCVTGGDDMAETVFMAEDAASGWVLTELEDGNKVPEATAINEVATDPGQFVSLIALDMDAYAAKYGSNAVKKTLTIPAWLNTFVEQTGISCSKVLQDALSKMAQAR